MDKLNSLNMAYFFLAGAIVAALIHLSKLETQSQIKIKIEAAKGQVSTEEKQLQTVQSLELERPKQVAEIASKKEIFNAALETMPTIANHREILESITSEAKMAGVRVVVLKPKEAPVVKETFKNLKAKDKIETPTSFYDESLYDIELEGSYTQLTYLFYLLTKIKPNISFRNILVIKKDFLEGLSVLSYKANLVSYKYKEPAAKPVAAPAKVLPKPAPRVGH